MTASALTEWVALFLPELIPDGQGGSREVPPANLEPDTPASVRMMSSSETASQEQAAQRVRYLVTIRYEPSITAAYRVYWQSRYLEIDGPPANVGYADKWLELQCVQREAGEIYGGN